MRYEHSTWYLRKAILGCVIMIVGLRSSFSSAAEQKVTIYGSFGSARDKITTELPALVEQYYPEILLEIVAPSMISPTAWTHD